MSMAQVKYIKVSGERISEQNKKAYGITRESSSDFIWISKYCSTK